MTFSFRSFKKLLMLSGVLFVPALLWPQAAEELEALMGNPRLNYGSIARIVLEAADEAVFFTSAEAFDYAKGQNWLPKNAAADGTARLDAVSLLLMRAFGMKGGIFYSLFKTPHYAYRELVSQKVIQDRASPNMPVSGDNLLFMLGRSLSIYEQRVSRWESLAAEINEELKKHQIADSSASVTNRGVKIILSNIQFKADSAELHDSEISKLDRTGAILQKIKTRKILISGHTALAGTSEGQHTVSLDRAKSVAAYLVKIGVRRNNEIAVEGLGASRPIADNRSADGMARNRRVEITILEDR